MQRVYLLTIIFTFIGLLQIQIYAQAENVIDVNLTKDCNNCLFKITWENTNKDAFIKILSPSGEAFSVNTTPERITKGDGKIFINVGDAKAGIWKVIIEGDTLGKTVVDAGELPVNVTIDHFLVSQEGDEFIAEWQTSNWTDNLRIQIYADTHKEGYDGIEVFSTWGKENGEATFTPSILNNGYYYYYICISDESGVFTYAYADSILKYEDMNSYDKLRNVNSCRLNEDIYISWTGESAEYKVLLYDADTMELLKEATTQNTSYVFSMPKDHSNVKAGVAIYLNKQLGQYDLYQLSNELPTAEVKYPVGDYSNQSTILVPVNFTKSYNVSATINGELVIDSSPTSGDYKVNLTEGENAIIFIVQDDNGNMRTFSKDLYVDLTPPHFALYNDVNNTVTDKTFIYLQGYTEAGATLYCNNAEVDLLNSYFSYKYPLKVGKNEIILSVKDLAGNETKYTAMVMRSFLGSRESIYLVVLLIGLLLGSVYIILFIRGVRGRKNLEKK